MKSSEKSNSYTHILKYTGLFGGVQGLNILISLVRNKCVALLLGPSGMGLVSLFNSTVKLLSDSTNMGISMTATRDISEAYATGDEVRLAESVKTVRSWSLMTALFGLIVCLALSPFLDNWTFNWGNHTLHYILLSPVVAFMAITGGELAILKGTRKLKQLALVTVYGVVGSLVFSVPLYYIWRESAIVPSLVIVAIVQMCLTVGVSHKNYPIRLSMRKTNLMAGSKMLRLGIAYMLAGVFGSGAEFIIRSYLNVQGSLELVGLYNAGYMMTMVYVGMVFSAMETDYFPRLSSITEVGKELYSTVNKQIEGILLLAAPMLITFIIIAPILLPLLFSTKFLPVLTMLRILLLAMYFRALTLPIEYINLAQGNSKWYLILELVYDVMIAAGVIIGFNVYELKGTGIAWLVVMILNALLVLIFAFVKYRFTLSHSVLRMFCLQFTLGVIVFTLDTLIDGWLYWLLGMVLIAVSVAISMAFLRDKVAVKDFLASLFKSRSHD